MVSASGGVIGTRRGDLERECRRWTPLPSEGPLPRSRRLTRMPNVGPTELIILLVIVLLIFGPKRLPGLGRQLGSGMREFKESITGGGRSEDDEGGDRDAFGRQRLDPGDEADRAEAGARSATTEPEVVGGEADPGD